MNEEEVAIVQFKRGQKKDLLVFEISNLNLYLENLYKYFLTIIITIYVLYRRVSHVCHFIKQNKHDSC